MCWPCTSGCNVKSLFTLFKIFVCFGVFELLQILDIPPFKYEFTKLNNKAIALKNIPLKENYIIAFNCKRELKEQKHLDVY